MQLLIKKYSKSLKWAKEAIKQRPDLADGYYLAATATLNLQSRDKLQRAKSYTLDALAKSYMTPGVPAGLRRRLARIEDMLATEKRREKQLAEQRRKLAEQRRKEAEFRAEQRRQAAERERAAAQERLKKKSAQARIGVDAAIAEVNANSMTESFVCFNCPPEASDILERGREVLAKKYKDWDIRAIQRVNSRTGNIGGFDVYAAIVEYVVQTDKGVASECIDAGYMSHCLLKLTQGGGFAVPGTWKRGKIEITFQKTARGWIPADTLR